MIAGRRMLLSVGVVAGCLLFRADVLVGADDPAKVSKAGSLLSPALAALRDDVRATLEMQQKADFNTRDNLPGEIMHYCLGFGCKTEVTLVGAEGGRINGITCLCYNYPCAGAGMLCMSQDHVSPRIGYGYQQRPGEFLAMLAMSRVPTNYPVRVGNVKRTVADIIEAEKLSCRAGSELSLQLVGLSYYAEAPQWKNDLDESWSIERMVEEELAKPVVTAADGGLNRLIGLDYAVERRLRSGEPLDGQYDRAAKFVADFHQYALRLQNSDGSWGPYFFASRGTCRDLVADLRSTGRIIEWLVNSLPEDQLQDARIAKSIEHVNQILCSQRYRWQASALPTREISAMGHALHALAIYDDRLFKPAEAAEKAAAETAAAEKAAAEKAAADKKAGDESSSDAQQKSKDE